MVTTLPPPEAPAREPEPPPPDRTIERRVGLPSGRAVVGALLMTVAAVGVFLAYVGADADPRADHVVAARDVPAGSVLTADDLTTARLDLGASVGDASFRDAAALVGQRLLAPLAEGELVQRSAVTGTPQDGPRNELTFRIAASRALNGDLVAGDLVDLYVSDQDGTTAVASDVTLLAAPLSAGRGELVLRLAIADDDVLVEVIDALNRGDVTVVRTTNAGD